MERRKMYVKIKIVSRKVILYANQSDLHFFRQLTFQPRTVHVTWQKIEAYPRRKSSLLDAERARSRICILYQRVHREIFYDFFYVKKSGLWLTGESSRGE